MRRKKVSQVVGGSPDQGSQHRNSQSKIEIRGVETIEEFFRPEFAQNTQSLDDINDDSDDSQHKENQQRESKLKRSAGGPKMAPFPQFSDDDDDNSPSNSSGQNSVIDIA